MEEASRGRREKSFRTFKAKLCKALENTQTWCSPRGLDKEMIDKPFQTLLFCWVDNWAFIQLDFKWPCAESWGHLSAGMGAPLCVSASHTDLRKPGPVPLIMVSPGCASLPTGWLISLPWQRIANMKCSATQNAICVTYIVNTYWHTDVFNVRMLRAY